MKILIISDLYPLASDRSIPSVVEDFALGLKEKVDKIEVIRPNFLVNTILRKHKIVKSGTYLKNEIKIYNRNFILPFIFENKKFIENFKDFDCIISHMPSGHIYSDLINKILNLPHISIVHQSDLVLLENIKYRFYFKRRLKNALKNSTLIGARNCVLARKFSADFILPSFVEKKNIVSKKIFKNDKLRLITLSKLIKRKNIDLVIKALKQVDFDFEYNIFGQGKEKKYLQNLINKYNLGDKIKINDYIEHDKIYEKLDESDVFVLISRDETFGISYFEALSRGLIVLASKNTGIDGFIEDNLNGFLVEPDVANVVKALNKIKNCAKDKISKNAISFIENFEKEKIITKYFENIKKIL